MDERNDQPDYNRPVAYDANGQPLYAHPPHEQATKPSDGDEPFEGSASPIADDIQLKHNKSQETFPELVLNEGDFVIRQVTRSLIGLSLPLFIGLILISLALIVLVNNDIIVNLLSMSGITVSSSAVFWSGLLLILFVFIVEYITYTVFVNNRIFLTNESVIQLTQEGLFSHSEHIVSLGNIEDASFTQHGIFQQMFDYGSIRLSTQGDETTYRITYITNPKEVITTLDCAIENFKNYHRVDH